MNIARGVVRKEPNYVYYWLKFLVGFSFGLISPVYAILLFSKGLNAFQVGMINLVFVLGNVFFSLPAGALADSWGRKKTFIVSTLFQGSAFLAYAFGQSWPFFALGEFLSSIGFVAMIGVLEAWVVDAWRSPAIRLDTEEEEYGFLFSRAEVAGNSASIIGGILGGLLGAVSLQLPFLIGAITNFSVLPMALILMKEEWVERKLKIKQVISKSLKTLIEGTKEGLKNRLISRVALFAGMTMVGLKALDMYWSKRFVDLALGRVWITGYLWPLMMIFMVMGSFMVKWWSERKKDYLVGLKGMALLMSVTIFLSAVLKNFYFPVFFFLLYEIGRGFYRPALLGYFNKVVSYQKRATILAFSNMAIWSGAAIGLLTLGWIAKRFSIEWAWLGASVVFLLALIPILRLKKMC